MKNNINDFSSDDSKDTELQSKTQYAPIDIHKLEVGTNLLIQTQDDTVYEVIVISPQEASVYIAGGKLFQRGIEATIISSYWEDDYDNRQPHIIQKGLCIEVKVPNQKIKSGWHYVSTTPVVSAKITAANESWELEVWEEKQ